jgi:hypothetical protein
MRQVFKHVFCIAETTVGLNMHCLLKLNINLTRSPNLLYVASQITL